mgnify:CR=1 FL=1
MALKIQPKYQQPSIMTITHVDRSLIMHIINLNLERWSLVGELDNNEYYTNITDVIAMADNISLANTDDIYDIYMREYTH